jgi:hypothetical protein
LPAGQTIDACRQHDLTTQVRRARRMGPPPIDRETPSKCVAAPPRSSMQSTNGPPRLGRRGEAFRNGCGWRAGRAGGGRADGAGGG